MTAPITTPLAAELGVSFSILAVGLAVLAYWLVRGLNAAKPEPKPVTAPPPWDTDPDTPERPAPRLAKAPMLIQGSRYTEFTAGPLPLDLTIGPQGWVDANLMFEHHDDPRPDTLIGDPAFDPAVIVKGPETDVLALFDAPTRQLVREAVSKGWQYHKNHWRLRHSGFDLDPHALGIYEMAGRLVRATLRAAEDPRGNLLEQATHDALPTIRRRALEVLLRHYPDRRAARRAMELHAASPDLHIRFIIARHRRDIAALADIVLHVPNTPGVDPLPPRTLRELAVAALEAIVDLDPRHPTTAELVDCFAPASPDTTPGLRRVALSALAVVPHPEAEPLLIAALADPDPDLQLAAVTSLRRVGTIAAVPALIPLRDRLLPSAVKTAATETIRLIQARVASPAAGALALSEEALAGSLALTASEHTTTPTATSSAEHSVERPPDHLPEHTHERMAEPMAEQAT